MELTERQIRRALTQFRSHVLAADHPAAVQFTRMFGAHTYFLDQAGLNILGLVEVPGVNAEQAEVIRLADWTDRQFASLETHPPEPTGIMVSLRDLPH